VPSDSANADAAMGTHEVLMRRTSKRDVVESAGSMASGSFEADAQVDLGEGGQRDVRH